MIDPIILARTVHIAATVLAAGTVCFLVLVAQPAFAGGGGAALAALRRRGRIAVWSALAVAVLSGAAWLALLSADIYGAPIVAVCLHGGLWTVLTGTQFGTVWTARLVLAVLLGLLLLWPGLRLLQLAAAGALIALLAYVGHAGASPGVAGAAQLVADMAHLLAAAVWLGGLPALAWLLLAQPGPEVAARATARFSALGIVSVATLIVSGLINSWNLLSGPRDLVSTGYGRVLALKLALFVAMLGIAAVNRLHLTPLLAAAGARAALARNSLAETGLGLGVLLLVGALGTMAPTAHHHLPTADVPADAAFVHIHSEQAMAEVTVAPGRAGPANVNIRILDENFSELPANAVHLTMEPPAPGPAPIDRAAVRQADGTWAVDGIDLPTAGNWTVRVTIGGNYATKIVLDGPIVIERAP